VAKLTPAQRQYVRKRTKIHDLDPSEMMGELNIIPFLDIVVNLIMFLLVTIISAIAMSQIESHLPEYRRGVGSRSNSPEATLNLNVTVVAAGVIVTGSGAKLAPGCETTGSGNVITVPRRGNGEYDWAGLTECVAKVKREFPEERQVIVTADPLIHYEHVVAAMDALREKDTDELFPEVLISAGVR
jgi:biopolymer transport protein TolR